MRTRREVTTAAAVLLAAVAAIAVWLPLRCRQTPPDGPKPDVLAIVGDRAITVADLEAAVRDRSRLTCEMVDTVLADLISRQAQVCAALEAGVDEDPAVRRARDNVLFITLHVSSI